MSHFDTHAAAMSAPGKTGGVTTTTIAAATQQERNCPSPPLDDLKSGKTTWQERVQALVGQRQGGYDSSMRRSVQSVILYEAKRIVSPLSHNLRPNQKKLAFLHQARALCGSLQCIPSAVQKEEIFWKTATSKEPITPDMVWKRLTLIEKELECLSKEIKPLLLQGRTHNEAVDMLVLDVFHKSQATTTTTDVQNKVPPLWEHAHNHVIMAFRLYYNGDHLDATFPAPVAPTEIIVPTEAEVKAQSFILTPALNTAAAPAGAVATGSTTPAAKQMNNAAAFVVNHRSPQNNNSQTPTQAPASAAATPSAAPTYYQQQQHMPPHQYPYPYGHSYPPPVASPENSNNNNNAMDNSNNSFPPLDPVSEERRRLLREVKDHLALLNELKDAIPPQEFILRKRALVAALPPAPPPQSANAAAQTITTTTTYAAPPPASTNQNGSRPAGAWGTMESAAATAAYAKALSATATTTTPPTTTTTLGPIAAAIRNGKRPAPAFGVGRHSGGKAGTADSASKKNKSEDAICLTDNYTCF